MSRIVTYELEATMDDGRVLAAIADQRDFVAYEGSEYFDDGQERFHTKVRHWAWTSLRRGKQTLASWKQFNENDCVQVKVTRGDDPEPVEGEDEQSLDPGRKEAGEGSA